MEAYTGVGSRETPDSVLYLFEEIARDLSESMRLRSGHSFGADLAFERGAGGNADIFMPYSHFNPDEPVSGIAHIPLKDLGHLWVDELRKAIDPEHVYHIMKKYTYRAFHCRNVAMVLGLDLQTPSKFVLLWGVPVPDNRVRGGTNTAYRVALVNDIPVYNFYNDAEVDRFFAEQMNG